MTNKVAFEIGTLCLWTLKIRGFYSILFKNPWVPRTELTEPMLTTPLVAVSQDVTKKSSLALSHSGKYVFEVKTNPWGFQGP